MTPERLPALSGGLHWSGGGEGQGLGSVWMTTWVGEGRPSPTPSLPEQRGGAPCWSPMESLKEPS